MRGHLDAGRNDVRLAEGSPPCPGESRRPTPPRSELRPSVLAEKAGGPPAEAAPVVGCSDQTVRNWVAQADRDAGRRSDGLTSEERAELAQLRRRVKVLELEKEILKEAAAWFAKESGSTP
jgi:transposase